MSKAEQQTFRVMTEFEARILTRAQAAQILGVTERTITRKAKSLRSSGLQGILHGNRMRVPQNKVSEELRERVLRLYREKYFDFNVTHFLEKLRKCESITISYSVLYSWCRGLGLVKRKKKRHGSPRHLRTRSPNEGLMLQLDGSHHCWNGKDEWVLIACIDDATSKIPWAEFFTSEDTLNCMTVLQRVIERFGIPKIIYTDKAGWFGGTTKREGFNHFVNACELLGIHIIFANSSQAKGRIERAWDTFQDRLVPEMRLNDIKHIPSANKFLQETFLPEYWQEQNTVQASHPEIVYRPLPSGVDLNEIFSLKETRQVKGNHTISWENNTYKVTPPGDYSIKGRTIELRTYQDLSTKSFFVGQEISIELVEAAPTEKPLRVNRVHGIGRDALKALIAKEKTEQLPTVLDLKKKKQTLNKNKIPIPVAKPLPRKRGRPKKSCTDSAA